MRNFINIVKSPSILLESQHYEEMFNPLFKLFDNLLARGKENAPYDSWYETALKTFNKSREEIQNDINWAKKILKRKDRIVYYLKLLRPNTCISLENYYPEMTALANRYRAEYKTQTGNVWIYFPRLDIQTKLEHYLSLPIPNIQNCIWENQSLVTLLDEFSNWEKEWQQERKHSVPHNEDDKIVMKKTFGSETWVWMHLLRASCDLEGDAMGHCGNSPRRSTTDTILSLRKKIDRGTEFVWKPYATFILLEDGELTEMKGRFNEKPGTGENSTTQKIIEDMIVDLLKLPQIKGIVGGGYLASNNFSLYDLDEQERDDLIELKPELADAATYLYTKGFDDVFVEKYETEFRDILKSSFESVDEDETVIEEWDSISSLISGLYLSDSSIDKIVQIMDGDYSEEKEDDSFDYVEILDSSQAITKTIDQDQRLSDMISSVYKDINEFLSINLGKIDTFLKNSRVEVTKLCEDFLSNYVGSISLQAYVADFRRADGGKYQLIGSTSEIADGMQALITQDGDDYGIYTVPEHGWIYTDENQSMWEEDNHETPADFLTELNHNLSTKLNDFVREQCFSPDQTSFDFDR